MKPQIPTQDVDLSNVTFDRDGVVRMALERKATQKKLWESMQQFANIQESTKSK
jgi:hypothetical protein